jgi:NAD(P)-dependent dehydrogenase (short-subunit alcohol dehydrogenase family)
MSVMNFSVADIPDLSGRVAVVTGANSGLGHETARALAARGAHVVLACRDLLKGGVASEHIAKEHPSASVELAELDLASLASIRAFAESFLSRHAELHILCNNAGVMALPFRQTADGFEMQLGTNHLGHFALTGLLLPRLLGTRGARVVTVSSSMHRVGRIRFEDLHGAHRYRKWGAYGQSKLANLLFTRELAHRAARRGAGLVAAAAHPGYAATNLQFAGPRMEGSTLMERLSGWGNRLIAQDAAGGALPTLYAATASDVRGGDYFGPGGLGELRGPPKRVGSSRRSQDREVAERLWQVSEDLTNVRFEALDP